MAIVVEEERNKGGIFAAFIWILILLGIGVGFYYIFFEQPSLVEIAVPTGFENTQEISKVDLNPDVVVNDPQFQLLRQYVTVGTPSTPGRANPFIAF